MPLGGEVSFTPSGYIHIHNNQFKVSVGVTFSCYPTNYEPGYPAWISIRMRQLPSECASHPNALGEGILSPSFLLNIVLVDI